jgi:UDP-N-acetylmuramoyl-L-alanyl-D-glutamate--2,6-diaminopimelate ligase
MMAAFQLDNTRPLGDLVPAGLTAGGNGRFATLPIAGLALDSRKVRPGDLFFAYPGEAGDGRDHIEQAIANGAVAILSEKSAEKDAEAGVAPVSRPVPVLEIPGLRLEAGRIAARFFDDPSAAMAVVGVTGTNGKTSCTQLLGQALRLAGRPCGVIGTLGSSLDGNPSGGGLTTPDPLALQSQLALWRAQNVSDVAMEVSSHGLVQGRVNGTHFRGAVFTNLTRDHLDFHGSMENYGAAKAALFDIPGLQFAVLNHDDLFGAALAARLHARVPSIVTFGFAEGATVRALNATYRADGIDAQVQTPWGTLQLRSGLLGDFNLSNLLAVVATLGSLGIDARTIETIAPRLQSIAGRMQRVPGAADIEVIVDYAHTPDGLEHALSALRQHCYGQLWCVFGCGGDRDRGKRPLMGAAAQRLADRVVLTSDNPRTEDAGEIIADILAGISLADGDTSGAVHVEADRRNAIEYAVRNAAAGDVILLAGKGHEDYQLIGGEVRPFSDSAAADAALAARSRA